MYNFPKVVKWIKAKAWARKKNRDRKINSLNHKFWKNIRILLYIFWSVVWWHIILKSRQLLLEITSFMWLQTAWTAGNYISLQPHSPPPHTHTFSLSEKNKYLEGWTIIGKVQRNQVQSPLPPVTPLKMLTWQKTFDWEVTREK